MYRTAVDGWISDREIIDGIGGGSGDTGALEIGEHERAIFGLFFILIVGVGGVEINAGAAFQRCEESGGDARADPISQSIQLIVRYYARILHDRLFRFNQRGALGERKTIEK